MALPTGCATRWKQASSKEIEEVAEDKQEFLALMIGSDGRGPTRDKAVVFPSSPLLLAGKKIRNTSNRDTQLWWSPRARCVRAGHANSNDNANGEHEVDERAASPLAGTQPLEAPQHIAGASEPISVILTKKYDVPYNYVSALQEAAPGAI